MSGHSVITIISSWKKSSSASDINDDPCLPSHKNLVHYLLLCASQATVASHYLVHALKKKWSRIIFSSEIENRRILEKAAKESVGSTEYDSSHWYSCRYPHTTLTMPDPIRLFKTLAGINSPTTTGSSYREDYCQSSCQDHCQGRWRVFFFSSFSSFFPLIRLQSH